ncbi:MAG: hypothetical protein HRT51_18455 [Colwellia sp.]|nr:hypothetical protein [Colwellia sp.]
MLRIIAPALSNKVLPVPFALSNNPHAMWRHGITVYPEHKKAHLEDGLGMLAE